MPHPPALGVSAGGLHLPLRSDGRSKQPRPWDEAPKMKMWGTKVSSSGGWRGVAGRTRPQGWDTWAGHGDGHCPSTGAGCQSPAVGTGGAACHQPPQEAPVPPPKPQHSPPPSRLQAEMSQLHAERRLRYGLDGRLRPGKEIGKAAAVQCQEKPHFTRNPPKTKLMSKDNGR